MAGKYSVALSKVIKAHSLETIYMPDKPESELVIRSQDVNRPGLMFAGYEKYFDPLRVEFVGLAEMSYLTELDENTQRERVELFFSLKPPVVIITRNIDILPVMLEMAEKYEVPLLRTAEPTSEIMATLISYLNTELAERITRHGVMVEVYGEGILILGDSGVGKSETAVELIKRGHRLIADDAVEIRKVSSRTLVGAAPDNIRHFIELRGIGIVNARNIFGIGSVKLTEKINMVIQLEQWDSSKAYDRLGLEDEYFNILGIKVPATVVPVKPGRNLAIIIEIAAMNNRQKRMGYNAARELMQQLGMGEVYPDPKELEVWH
ncbi:MAG: HPr(Ser) kinase/phosphatase [Ruminococcaceae bacterium]|nr:HPr(Ser) kinase/phosphatase [Oscillospiraceae bacterium]